MHGDFVTHRLHNLNRFFLERLLHLLLYMYVVLYIYVVKCKIKDLIPSLVGRLGFVRATANPERAGPHFAIYSRGFASNVFAGDSLGRGSTEGLAVK